MMSLKINEEIKDIQQEVEKNQEQNIWTIDFLISRFIKMNEFIESAIHDIAKTIALELHEQNIYIAVYQDVITKCHKLQDECAIYPWLNDEVLYRYFEKRVIQELESNRFFNVIYHYTHESRPVQVLDNTGAYEEFAHNLKHR